LAVEQGEHSALLGIPRLRVKLFESANCSVFPTNA
jgi:hypothetical protein